MNIRDRKDPELGEIVAVPLGDGQWAYLCSTGGVRFYPYNFISVKLLKDKGSFARENWLRPIGWEENMPATYRTVTKIELSKEEPFAGMWKIDKFGSQFLGISRGSYVYRDTRSWRLITPLEAETIPEEIWLDQSSIVEYIKAQNLRVLQGTEEAPPLTEKDYVAESLDLQVTVYTETCDYDPEQLEAEITNALEKEEVDGWELIDGSDGEIVIRVETDSATEVTALMRRVMKEKLTPAQLQSVMFERIEEGRKPRELSILPKSRRKNP